MAKNNINGSINRRRVLQASGGSLTTSVVSGKVAADSGNGDDGPPGDFEKPPRQPDLKIADNSRSEAAIKLRLRSMSSDGNNTSSGSSNDFDPENRPILVNKDVPTKGARHPDFEDRVETKEVGDHINEDVDVDVDRSYEVLSFTEPIEESRVKFDRLDEVQNEVVAVEVEHQGNSDHTRLNIYDNGAADELTVNVTIDEQGDVHVTKTVYCY